MRLAPTLALLAVAALAGAACAQAPATQHQFGDAARWTPIFDDPRRDAWQKPHEVIERLALKPDAIVADIGAGTGYFTVRLARMLPKATVYAADIESDMVKHLGERAQREKLTNVRVVQSSLDDARLPEPVDLALLVDAYHHIDDRRAYFGKLKSRLKPGGRVAIIDFTLDAEMGPPPRARVAPERVKAELAAAGFRLAEEYGFLDNQYFLVFAP